MRVCMLACVLASFAYHKTLAILNLPHLGIFLPHLQLQLHLCQHTTTPYYIDPTLQLKGETRTLQSYLSYGLLEEENPIHFSSVATAVLYQDHHWRMMATWQSNKWNATLPTLDGQVFMGISCRKPYHFSDFLLIVSNYTSAAQAAAAFVGTGAISEKYDGMDCSDGGSTSGAKMTPLFQDQVRPQLIIDLMETGFPISMGGGKYTSTQYAALVRRGQDEIGEFLRTGTVARSPSAISLCPLGRKVSANVCGDSE